jgi:cAMP-specific phosphodiesterase 4
MLNKELSQFTENNNDSDNQISDYINNIFLDKQQDEIDLLTNDKNNNSNNIKNVHMTLQRIESNKAMSNIFALGTNLLSNSNNGNTNGDIKDGARDKYGVEVKDLDEMDKIMANLDLWGIDVFLINDLTLNRPLTAVAYSIFKVIFLPINKKKIENIAT